MHISALHYGKIFFEKYLTNQPSSEIIIVDVGAQNVNGSLRQVAPLGCKYLGVDFVAGAGVDIVLNDPYKLPFETGSVDAVVCSSVYEHSEFFWLLFLESLRILKPTGLLYLNAPSNGALHRYPIDAWRFYPDAGKSLTNWARHNGMNAVLLESFIGAKQGDLMQDGMWNDFIAVIAKDEDYIQKNNFRMVDAKSEIHSAYVRGSDLPVAAIELMPDLLLMEEQIRELERARSNEKCMSQLVEKIQDEKEKLCNEINLMRNSRCWRYTSWVRNIFNVIGGIK